MPHLPPPPSLLPIPISGRITLAPSAHGTAQLTFYVTLEWSVALASPNLPRSKSTLNHLLSLISTLHKRFARYQEVDRARCDAFEEQIKIPPPIRPREDNLVTSAMTDTGGWKRIAGTVRESVAYFHKAENNANWGKGGEASEANACTGTCVCVHMCVCVCVCA